MRAVQVRSVVLREQRHLAGHAGPVCYHSLAGRTETILGFGIISMNSVGSPSLSSLPASMISTDAFEMGVRTDAAGNEFEAMLPLYISTTHGHKCLSLLPEALKRIIGRDVSSEFPRALTSTVARLLKASSLQLAGVLGGGGQAEWGGTALGMLQVYCHLHHLLLGAAVNGKPGLDLQSTAATVVVELASGFIDKGTDPTEVLVMLALVAEDTASWRAVLPRLLKQLLMQQVADVIRTEGNIYGQPYLDGGRDGLTDDGRRTGHFSPVQQKLRGFLIQYWLVNDLGRPVNQSELKEQLRKARDDYTYSLGKPPKGTARRFLAYVDQVRRCSDWDMFLGCMQLDLCYNRQGYPAVDMADVLRQCVVEAYELKWHNIRPCPWNWRMKRYLRWTDMVGQIRPQ